MEIFFAKRMKLGSRDPIVKANVGLQAGVWPKDLAYPHPHAITYSMNREMHNFL